LSFLLSFPSLFFFRPFVCSGIGLAVAARLGWITATEGFSVGEVQVGMQDFLVCIEMFIAACTHKYTFGSETYADGTLRTIMEQRSMYLAEQSYKRGVEAQNQALVAAGLPTPDPNAETEEERIARQEAMAELIRRNIDEDTEGDVLFNEDLVDWTSGALPMQTDASGAVVLSDAARMHAGAGGEGGGMKHHKIHAAYDYVYAYELERQQPEGVDLPPSSEQEQQLQQQQQGKGSARGAKMMSPRATARYGSHAGDYAAAGASRHSLADEIDVDFGYGHDAGGDGHGHAADPTSIAIVAAAPEMLHEEDIVDQEDPQRHFHTPAQQHQRPPQKQKQQQQQQQRLPPQQVRVNGHGRTPVPSPSQQAQQHDDVFGDDALAAGLQSKKGKKMNARMPPPQQQQVSLQTPQRSSSASAPRVVSATPTAATGGRQQQQPQPARAPSSARAASQQQQPQQQQQQRRPAPPPQSHHIDLDENPFE
jgi:hypothetical protein